MADAPPLGVTGTVPVENAVPKEVALLEVLFDWVVDELDTNPLETGEVPVENAVPWLLLDVPLP